MLAAFALRGIVEGFYGRPWSIEDRLDLIAFIAEHGGNAYVLAPKDDAGHRARWRAALDREAQEHARALVDECRRRQVRFVVALAPGLDARYGDESDQQALLGRVSQYQGLGVKDFALLFDDIEQDFVHEADRAAFSGLAQAHAAWTRRLRDHCRARDPDALLLMCPTIYWGADHEYQRALGRHLPEGVFVFWTGMEVFNRRIPAEDAQAFRRVMPRPVVLWDNYPVNDFPSRNRVLYLGPYSGREVGLQRHLVGLLANPMPQAQASKLALCTVSRFWRNPAMYNEVEAMNAAILELAGADRAGSLRLVVEECLGHWAAPRDPNPAASLIAGLWADDDSLRGIARQRLRERFSRLRELPRRLATIPAAPRLAAELAPLAERLSLTAECCLRALELRDQRDVGALAALESDWRALQARDWPLDLNSQAGADFIEAVLAGSSREHSPAPSPGESAPDGIDRREGKGDT